MATITEEEIEVIKGMMGRAQDAILERIPAEEQAAIGEDELKAIVAQNVLRDVMSAVIEYSLPVEEQFAGSLALRMASYAISVAPIENQEMLVDYVVRELPGAHSDRLKRGAVIRTGWSGRDGVSHPNVPDKGSVN